MQCRSEIRRKRKRKSESEGLQSRRVQRQSQFHYDSASAAGRKCLQLYAGREGGVCEGRCFCKDSEAAGSKEAGGKEKGGKENCCEENRKIRNRNS